MRVLIRPRNADQTRGRLGPLAYTPLKLSAQQMYSPEAVLSMLEACTVHANDVDNMFIEYENCNIPITSVNELPLVAQLASAYHNVLVCQNLHEQKDLYGLAYTEYEATSSLHDPLEEYAKNPHEDDDSEDTWNEEQDGEEVVFNAHFESHADLGQPWLDDRSFSRETWGFYT